MCVDAGAKEEEQDEDEVDDDRVTVADLASACLLAPAVASPPAPAAPSPSSNRSPVLGNDSDGGEGDNAEKWPFWLKTIVFAVEVPWPFWLKGSLAPAVSRPEVPFPPTCVVDAELGEVVRDGPFWLKGAAGEVEVDSLPGKSVPKTGG